jgi:predicted HTH transcriptional regulator
VQEELRADLSEEIVPPIIPLIDNIAFDSGKRIVALDVQPRRKPYRTREGRFYMRFGARKREVSREQLSMWLDEIRPLGYENVPLFTAEPQDFDDGLLGHSPRAFEDVSPTINLYQTADFLKKDLILAVGGADEFFPTLRLSCFSERMSACPELFPRSVVTVVVTRATTELLSSSRRLELKGNLHTQNEAIIAFIERYCDLVKEKPKKSLHLVGSPVAARASYHVYAIREAVAKRAHPSRFCASDIPTRITIYDNFIEIVKRATNQGFVPPASRAIRYGITQRLNPQIASIFSRREYGTSVPRGGVPMILKQSERLAGKRAELYTANDEFKLKIYGV